MPQKPPTHQLFACLNGISGPPYILSIPVTLLRPRRSPDLLAHNNALPPNPRNPLNMPNNTTDEGNGSLIVGMIILGTRVCVMIYCGIRQALDPVPQKRPVRKCLTTNAVIYGSSGPGISIALARLSVEGWVAGDGGGVLFLRSYLRACLKLVLVGGNV
ncbi:uncharacterized protein BDV17DRAFT_296099 [Aspergillus undulatus]|uniref:uncharacterized protein n=1 Tax=Aspergillus undulatus TaxID=1810928 RepID=UPI003CCD3863